MPSFRLLILALCLCLSNTNLVLWANEDISVKDLPKPVLATINARYPKAELTAARKTLEDKTEIYEVELTNDKTAIEIAVLADGKIDWVAVDLDVKELPKPVLAGIRKKYPAATLDDASIVYTVKDGKDKLEHYFVELTTKAGKTRHLDVLPNGMIEEDDEAE
jgi:hypothetical protein